MAKKDENKVRFTLYLEQAQVDQLEAASERTGAPVAELIRRAIDSSEYIRAAASSGLKSPRK
ncbi:MAG: ribbon-helix-helix domain-containing protein [Candidatus Sulfotelmatobacter sp.]